ncbi:hypothetical protein JOE51_007606 [Bradyrhizobium japonicum]|nr:hypothetical protein [Bradyrhizobium japonicum]
MSETVEQTYQAIGQYVVAFSGLERSLREIACDMLSLTDDQSERLMPVLDFVPVCNICKAEILSRTADSERRTLLVNLINKAMKTVEDRNRVAHGYWFFIQSGPMNVHASRTTLRETGYFHDPNELVEKAKEIQELRDEIWERFIVEAT